MRAARNAASHSATRLLVQPVFTLVWGVLLFSEHLSDLQWAGAALVLGGVAVVSRQSAKTRAAEWAPAVDA